METTRGLGFRGILGLYWGNGKENGSYYSRLVLGRLGQKWKRKWKPSRCSEIRV